MTRIKICCIQSKDEARMAIAAGASALGLVSAMPSGPGVITEEQIVQIAPSVPPGVASVLLTSATSSEEIIAQQRRSRVNAVQICDSVSADTLKELREKLPGIAILAVIHVTDESSLAQAVACNRLVDCLLLDSGNQSLAVKELGGTGRTHDWSISAEIVNQFDGPVFLAGGLRPENVVEAIQKVRPYGVDICTGVRTAGALDSDKLGAFVEAVRSA